MSVPLRPVVTAALVSLCLGLALLAPAIAVDRAGAAPRTVAPAVFNRDLAAAASSLNGFATILRGTATPGQFAAEAKPVRRYTNAFGARIVKMSRYRVGAGALERKRKAVVRTGVPLTAAMRQLLALAVRHQNVAATRYLSSTLLPRVSAFSRAAGLRRS